MRAPLIANGRVLAAASALRAWASTPSIHARDPRRAGRRPGPSACVEGGDQPARPSVEHGDEQLVLAAEVPVERLVREARLLHDVAAPGARRRPCGASPRTPASTRRRTSSAYASERTESVLDATRSATGGSAPSSAAGGNGVLHKRNAIPAGAGGESPGPSTVRRRAARLAAPHPAGRPHAPLRAPTARGTTTRSGEILATGLADGADLAFKVRSRLRPYSGTLGDVADVARRVAGGLACPGRRPGRPGRVPAAELGRGGGDVLGDGVPRRGAGADRALLRHEGSRVHPPAVRRTRPRDRRPLRSPRLPRQPRHDPLRRSRSRDGRRGVRRRRPARPAPVHGARRWRRGGRARARRSVRARARRVHLRHDRRSEGRRARAPHHRLRDPPARRDAGRRGRPGPHRRTGRARHRHARRAAHPRLPARPDPPDRRVGPGDRARRHARRPRVQRRGSDVLPHQPARPSRLHGRAPGADAPRRDGRLVGPGGGDRPGRCHGHLDRAHVRVDRAPVDHRRPARGTARQTAVHRRPPAARRRAPAARRRRQGGRRRRPRRDLQPRAGLLPRVHGPHAHEGVLRRRRVVRNRRRRRAGRRRLSLDRRPQEGHHHPRR